MGSPLTEMLATKVPLILDGAMGTELQRRGVEVGLPLWSANALIAHPEVVLEIHRDYIAAGADIITTNTFRSTRRTMHRAHLPDRSEQLTTVAVTLAKRAREEFPDRQILIAGSMAPLEDCYRPDLVPSDKELEEEHRELAVRLADGGVDVILVETMNTIREAYAACRAAKATGKEVVVSFLCREEGTLYSGESFEEALKSVGPLEPTTLSVNCASPHVIRGAAHILRQNTTTPFAVYANVGVPNGEREGGELVPDILEEEYAIWARRWADTGASIVGGCCGTTPGYIQAVWRALNRHP